MTSKISKKAATLAFVIGMLATAIAPGIALAAPGECEDVTLGQIVKDGRGINGTPMGGPNETWGWAHPDGKTANPGQAMQYYCHG